MIPESRAFHAYIEAARPGGTWWQVLLGIVVVVAVWFGAGLGLAVLISTGIFSAVGLGPGALDIMGRTLSPAAMIIFLLTFVGLWAGVWIAVRAVHRRPLGSLFGPGGRLDRGDMLRGAGLSAAYLAVGLVAYIAIMGPPQRTELAFSEWAVWIVPVVLAICVQASSEEVMFRGYLLQHFAVWSRNPIVWAVIPTLIFAVLHYDPEMEAGMRWRMLVHIALFGLIAAALVWRTGNLGAAVGLHVANNIFAIGNAGIEGSALGFELWLFPAETLERMFAFDLALGLLMLAAVFILFRPRSGL